MPRKERKTGHRRGAGYERRKKEKEKRRLRCTDRIISLTDDSTRHPRDIHKKAGDRITRAAVNRDVKNERTPFIFIFSIHTIIMTALGYQQMSVLSENNGTCKSLLDKIKSASAFLYKLVHGAVLDDIEVRFHIAVIGNL